MLEAVTLVLELTDGPMRACDIYAAADALASGPLRQRSVRGTLSAYPIGVDRRFRRVRRGVYELAH